MRVALSFCFGVICHSFTVVPSAFVRRISTAPINSVGSELSAHSKALLFDCDGVIIETESIHLTAYNAAYKKNGLTNPDGSDVFWSVEYYDMLQNTVGGGKNKMRFYFDKTIGGWPSSSGGAAPETDEEKQALVDKLQDEKTLMYQDLVKEEAEARPGLLSLLDEALADPECAVGVCSAATKSAVQTVLDCALGPERTAGLDVFLAGDDVAAKKPDPLIYTTAMERLGVDPSVCVVVEDSLIGLKAAKAAGAKCLITYTDSTKQEDFYGNGADAVMEDLSCFGGIKFTDVFSSSGFCVGKQEGPKAEMGQGDDIGKVRDLLMSL